MSQANLIVVRVLGGQGAVEDEEELPELSDSGDEAAWEDEADAELPHDKQQTPCLFCNRFVPLNARLQTYGALSLGLCVVCKERLVQSPARVPSP